MTEPTLTTEELRLLASAGGAAPSLHNSQPWRLRWSAATTSLRVYADRERSMPLTDPDGRALHISVGAALFNLRVAAQHLGLQPVVRLLPEEGEPDLLAVLDLSRAATAPSTLDLALGRGADPGHPTARSRNPAATPSGRDLYPAVAFRHSSRRPFANRDVPEAVLGELIAAARAEGALLSPLEEDGVRRVSALTAEAEQRTADDPARLAEIGRWLRPAEPADGPDSAPDGIPQYALGPQDHDARVPMRGFTGHPPRPAVPSERFEALPQLCTLTTLGDRPAHWLRAGQALEHVWLLATVHGVRLSVLNQALEWPDTRWALRDPATGPGHVQLVVRLGYGPPGPTTPRRAVPEILTAD
ncbi:nitroreductase family protein [Kitasatospora cystarginea]|uniref:Nitroreductase family protein n=1 Tax=Kitasatospora cystarginea TaxID=58350 RepID=A0ABN3DLJ7_9ACTN